MKGGGRDEEVGAVGAAADSAAVVAVAERLCVCGTNADMSGTLYCRVVCALLLHTYLEVYLAIVGDCAFSAYCSFGFVVSAARRLGVWVNVNSRQPPSSIMVWVELYGTGICSSM